MVFRVRPRRAGRAGRAGRVEDMKTFTFTVTEDDGGYKFVSTNEGFGGHELLGFLDMKHSDILAQLFNESKPDIVFKRTVIKEDWQSDPLKQRP